MYLNTNKFGILRFWSYIYRIIIKTYKHMKTVLGQLMELNEKMAELEKAIMSGSTSEFEPCCDGECGCSSEGDEYVEGTNEDVEQVILTRGESVNDPYELAAGAGVIVFTRDELVDFATRLTARVIISAKEAVTDTGLDTDSLVTLELSAWSGNTIDIELDKESIVESIHSEIDDAINVDSDSIEDEITDILSEMYSEIQS